MSESRTSNSLRNITFNIGNQLLNLLLAFISRSVFLSVLNVEYLGISGLFGDIFAMLCLADLGIGSAMTYSMYKPLAEHDYDRLAGLVTLYRRIYLTIAAAITCLGFALIPFLKYLVNLDTDMPQLELYYILGLLNCVSSYLVVYKTSILHADQKGYLISKYSGLFNILKTVFTTVFLLITRSYILHLIIQVAFTYFTNLFNSHIAVKHYPFIQNRVKLAKGEASKIFSNIKSVFLYKLSSVLITATDNTLISVMVNTASVGYYSNYMVAVTKVYNIVNTVFYSLTASLGNLIVKENEKRRYEIFQIMQAVSLILSTFCVACVFCLEEDFIRIWIGSEYLLDKTVLWAIVTNFYFSIILMPIWVFREATGLYQKTKYVMLSTAAVNLITSVVLGRVMGLAGILFATSIARLATYFWYEPVLLFKNYFGKSSLIYFGGVLKSLLTTLAIVLTVSYCMNTIHITSWLGLLLKACAVGITSLLLVILIYHRSEGLQLVLRRAKSMIHK